MSKFPLLSAEEEKQLFREYNSTVSYEIREKILHSNLRLVISIARKYKTRIRELNIDFLDLVQVGNEGLMVALEKFDVELGDKFSTYSTHWIEHYMLKHINYNGRPIKVSHSTIEWYNKFKKYIDANYQIEGVKPSNLKIANAFCKDEKFVSKIMMLMESPVYSLNDTFSVNSEVTIIDTIASNELLLEDDIIEKDTIYSLNKLISDCLTYKEDLIVSLRYGIVNQFNSCSEPKKLRKVGEILGLTKERVRQIEKGALYKLRNLAKREKIKIL